MKKILTICFVAGLMTSSVFAKGLLGDILDTAKSVKNTAESTKNIVKSNKKKVADADAATDTSSEKEVAQDAYAPLTSIDAFMIYMNLSDTKITEEMNLDYAKTIGSETYEKYHDDEFEWQEQYASLKNQFKNSVDTANVDGKFAIMLNIEFGDYDFENQGYKVTISPDTFVPYDSVRSSTESYMLASESIFAKKLAMKFIDLEKYNFLPMEKDAAKQLLQSRKRSSGYVDRRLTIIIHFEIDSFNTPSYKNWAKACGSKYLPLTSVISSVETFDNSQNKMVPLGELQKK